MDNIARWSRSVPVIVTLTVAVPFLLSQTYRAHGCFQRGSMFGCGSSLHPFSLEALPAIVGPLLAAGVMTAAAGLVANQRLSEWQTFAIAAHVGAGLLFVISGAVVFVLPLVVTLGVALALAGLPRWRAAVELLSALAVALLGAATAYAAVAAVMSLRGGWISSGLPLVWVYFAYVSAVGLAVGWGLTSASSSGPQLARGLGAAYVGAGAAGILTLLVLPVTLGKGIVFLAAPLLAVSALPLGSVSGRILLGLPWASALTITGSAVLGFGPFVAATFYVVGAFAQVAALGPSLPLPHVPWLPGTSTR